MQARGKQKYIMIFEIRYFFLEIGLSPSPSGLTYIFIKKIQFYNKLRLKTPRSLDIFKKIQQAEINYEIKNKKLFSLI